MHKFPDSPSDLAGQPSVSPLSDERSHRLHQLIEAARRQAAAQIPPPLVATTPDDILGLAGVSWCPFPQAVLTQRISYGIPLSTGEEGACRRATLLKRGHAFVRASVACTPVPVVLDAGQQPAYRIRYFGHAEIWVLAHRVHMDVICLELSAPGGVNNEVRVYVDGELRGRGIVFGRLGGTGNSLPALAAVTPHVLISVNPVGTHRYDTLIVELVHTRPQVHAGPPLGR